MAHILNQLFDVIQDRKDVSAEESYVAALLAKGTGKISQKVGEEAVEVIVEAMKGDTEALKSESADLLFHLMVLWADQGITPEDVFSTLAERFGTSGHEEKRNRT